MKQRYFPIFMGAVAILYVVIAMVYYTEYNRGDEERYIMFANNLLKGTYSPERLNIWSGPGYPLVLAPFAPFGKRVMILLNPVFIMMGLLFFNKTLKDLKFRPKLANGTTVALALFPFLMPFLAQVMTECFTYFLVCATLYISVKYYRLEQKKDFFLLCLLLGALALTKILFFYVLLLMIGVAIIISLKKRKMGALIARLSVFSLLIASPWLFYTYHLTGKVFYLSNAGGATLYWMSTPHPNEYGDWHTWQFTKSTLAFYDVDWYDFHSERLDKNHLAFARSLDGLSPLERDQKLKEQAIKQIKKRPLKYAENIVCTMGRMWFNMPYSYYPQVPFVLVRVSYMAFVFVFFVLSCCWLLYRRSFELIPFLPVMVFMTYLALSTLVCAHPRMLDAMMPFIFFLIVYSMNDLVVFLRTAKPQPEHKEQIQ